VVAPGTTFAIGYLSGNQYPTCNFNSGIAYSVPGIAGVTQYVWTLATDATSPRQLNMSFGGASSITTTLPSVGATLSTTTGYATGTLTVTARTPCGSTSTRTFVINRSSPPSGISGPSSICAGSSAYYYAPDGSSNHYWTASSSTGSFWLNGSSGSSTMLQGVSQGSGVIQLTYNRACDNLSSTDRMGVYVNSCGYYTTTDQVTLSVSPNPASDAVEVTYTEKTKAYPVKVYNAYNKVVAAGTLRNGKLRLNLGRAPVGVYLVHLLDETRGVVSVRLAKN
ncbi:MAG: T9SS type A sorting domain-containing protein, partial [Cytophagales bacterium]|nr:T9SS type A sorting domain-containing protein [Cytophagales bacterium]